MIQKSALVLKIGLIALLAYFYLFNLWGVVAPFFVNFYPPPEIQETDKFRQFVTERLADMTDVEKMAAVGGEKSKAEAQKLSEMLKDFDLSYRELLHVLPSDYKGTPAQDIHQARTVLLGRFSWLHALMWLLIAVTLALAGHCVYLIVKARFAMHVGWILLLFVNLICLKLTWSSGNLDFNLININISPFGFSQADVNPWLLRANLPFGLIAFLRQYYKYGMKPPEPAITTFPPSE